MSSKSQLWTLYQKAKTYSRLPSELLRLDDEWTAYQLDNAVTLFGIAIENALGEQTNAGTKDKPEYEQKYTLDQLLDPDFRLPAKPRKTKPQGLQGLMGMPGVKVVKAR